MNNFLLSFQSVFDNLRATFGDTVLIISGLVLFFLILYFLQYKGVQIFAVVLFSLVLIGSSVFCGIKIEKYYSASGGIVGQIESLLKPNQVEINKTEICFSFENLMMTKDEENNYSVYVVSEEILKLEDDEEYEVFINNLPCKMIENTSDYIEFNYSYVFYNKRHEVILDDTLYIQIAFYKTRTELEVYTTGGVEAKNLWQSYFNKNNFELRLEKVVVENTNSLQSEMVGTL